MQFPGLWNSQGKARAVGGEGCGGTHSASRFPASHCGCHHCDPRPSVRAAPLIHLYPMAMKSTFFLVYNGILWLPGIAETLLKKKEGTI